MNKIFENITVLELSETAGEHAGKLFAGMGAKVIKIEHPSGSKSRRIGPFVQNIPNNNTSIKFFNNNVNKLSITLDITKQTGLHIFNQLLKHIDIVIEDGQKIGPDFMPFSYKHINTINKSTILLSLSPLGKTLENENFTTNDLVNLAYGGPLWSCGYDDHTIPPMKPYQDASYHISSHYAFMGALLALFERNKTNIGQHVDLSIHEACHDTTEAAMPAYYYNNRKVGRLTGRHASPAKTLPVVFKTNDEKWCFIRIPTNNNTWNKLITWLKEHHMENDLDNTEYQELRFRQENAQHITDILEIFCLKNDSDYLFHKAQSIDMVWAPVVAPYESLSNKHLIERNYFTEIFHPELNQNIKYPGRPYLFSKTPFEITTPAPSIGQDNNQIFSKFLGLTNENIRLLKQAQIV
jgi:benzylsuccinate CoA-transferase BbsE subunit